MEDVRLESGLRFADSDDLIFVNYPSSDDDQKEDEEPSRDDQPDSLEEVELGPGYRSILQPEPSPTTTRSPELSPEPQTEEEDEGSETESESDLDHSTSAGSSYDSSSDSGECNPSSQGSIKTESKESACQSSDYQSASLKLKPLKITLSFDLTKPDPDIDGIVRKDRTNSTSYTSCNDDDVTDDVITEISSDNSLDHFTDHSSASEFRGSPQQPGEYETSDVEAGGVKDRRRRGIGAGFIALWGLGRLWLNPSKSRRNVRL